MKNQPKSHCDSLLLVDCGDNGHPSLDPKSGSKARLVTESDRQDEQVRVFRVDSPDGKTFVTLKVAEDPPPFLFPPNPKVWMYRECSFSVTDIASGKTRMISDQFGELLFDRGVILTAILPLDCVMILDGEALFMP